MPELSSDESREDDWIGRRIGHIRIVGRLGESSFATVYHGIDETLGRSVALVAAPPSGE